MPPNVQAQRVGREIGRSYDEVRRALNVLIYIGEQTPEKAESIVKQLAAAGVDDVSASARASIQDKREGE